MANWGTVTIAVSLWTMIAVSSTMTPNTYTREELLNRSGILGQGPEMILRIQQSMDPWKRQYPCIDLENPFRHVFAEIERSAQGLFNYLIK